MFSCWNKSELPTWWLGSGCFRTIGELKWCNFASEASNGGFNVVSFICIFLSREVEGKWYADLRGKLPEFRGELGLNVNMKEWLLVILTLGRVFETQMSAVMITRGISERYPSSETFFVFLQWRCVVQWKYHHLAPLNGHGRSREMTRWSLLRATGTSRVQVGERTGEMVSDSEWCSWCDGNHHEKTCIANRKHRIHTWIWTSYELKGFKMSIWNFHKISNTFCRSISVHPCVWELAIEVRLVFQIEFQLLPLSLVTQISLFEIPTSLNSLSKTYSTHENQQHTYMIKSFHM